MAVAPITVNQSNEGSDVTVFRLIDVCDQTA
jgi:hypothetical protein